MKQQAERCAWPLTALVAVAAVMSLASPAAEDQPTSSNAPPPADLPASARHAWMRVETPNFTLFGEVPEARLLAIAARLESYREALEWLHPGSRASPRETFVYVFKDVRSGWPFTPAPMIGGHHLGVTPQYDVGNYVTVAAPFDDPPLEVLYHSYAHQFLDDNLPRLPLTVTEGLAEFYSGFAVAREGTLIGLMNTDHLRWLRGNAPLSLSEQFSLDAHATLLATENGREAFVAGSWALMHYLVSGIGEKRTQLPVFLKALQRGTPPGDAARFAFGVSLDQLQNEIGRYVLGNHFLPMRIRDRARSTPVPLAPPDVAPTREAREGTTFPDEIAMHGRPMSKDEILAALGDVLVHAGTESSAVAEAYFRQALRLNVDQAQAHAGLGYLRYSQNRFDESIPFFEKAIAIEPDALSCYLLARSLLKVNAVTQAGVAATPAAATPPWLVRARDLLARSIALRPRFAAPYVTLGATHTLSEGDVAAGIDLLQKARMLLPARTDITTNLVYLYLRQGDFIRAQKLVDTALVDSGDEHALKQALASIATFQRHVAARQSVHKTRLTPAEEERQKAWQAAQAQILREKLARTDDPETRAKIEEGLKRLEIPPPGIAYNRAVEVYNEAVDKANKRDYSAAIALLAGLLPKVEDAELKEKIKDQLERFRQDAARLHQPAQ